MSRASTPDRDIVFRLGLGVSAEVLINGTKLAVFQHLVHLGLPHLPRSGSGGMTLPPSYSQRALELVPPFEPMQSPYRLGEWHADIDTTWVFDLYDNLGLNMDQRTLGSKLATLLVYKVRLERAADGN